MNLLSDVSTSGSETLTGDESANMLLEGRSPPETEAKC